MIIGLVAFFVSIVCVIVGKIKKDRRRALWEKDRLLYMKNPNTRLNFILARIEEGTSKTPKKSKVLSDPRITVQSASATRVYDYVEKSFFGMVQKRHVLESSEVFVQPDHPRATPSQFVNLSDFARLRMVATDRPVISSAQDWLNRIAYSVFYDIYWLGISSLLPRKPRVQQKIRVVSALGYYSQEEWWKLRCDLVKKRLYEVELEQESWLALIGRFSFTKNDLVRASWQVDNFNVSAAIKEVKEAESVLGRTILMNIVAKWIFNPKKSTKGFADFITISAGHVEGFVFVLNGDENVPLERILWIEFLLQVEAPVVIFRVDVQQSSEGPSMSLHMS